MNDRPVYWFRVPRLTWLKSLSHPELICFLAVLEAIQLDRQHGQLSLAQIATRTGLSRATTTRAISRLVTTHWLLRTPQPGLPSRFSLPFSWRSSKPKAPLLTFPFHA